MTHVYMSYGRVAKLGFGGRDAKTRNQRTSYIDRQHQLCGLVKIVNAWHAIGRTVSCIIEYIQLLIQK